MKRVANKRKTQRKKVIRRKTLRRMRSNTCKYCMKGG